MRVSGLSPSGLGGRLALLLSLLSLPTLTLSKAILGVDLGSLYMKVALVQRNSPLEIVTNLHSKRKTEQMVLFDQGTRFYGADANSMAARKPQKIPAGMSVMLGREAEHPTVKVGIELRFENLQETEGKFDDGLFSSGTSTVGIKRWVSSSEEVQDTPNMD